MGGKQSGTQPLDRDAMPIYIGSRSKTPAAFVNPLKAGPVLGDSTPPPTEPHVTLKTVDQVVPEKTKRPYIRAVPYARTKPRHQKDALTNLKIELIPADQIPPSPRAQTRDTIIKVLQLIRDQPDNKAIKISSPDKRAALNLVQSLRRTQRLKRIKACVTLRGTIVYIYKNPIHASD